MPDHTNPQDITTQQKLHQIQTNFGAAAADYVTSKVHSSGPDLDWLIESAALTGTERVLDIATGAGHTAFALAPYAYEVVALDITPEMLTVAQEVATQRNLHNISFLQADAQSIPCPDVSFDLITCRQAAHHFPNILPCIQEWARLLNPNGKLILIDSISPEEPAIDALLHEVEILRDPSHMRSQRLSEWHSLLTSSGFIVSSAREIGIILDIPSWTQRMRTPLTSVNTIEHLLAAASPAARTRLKIENQNNVFSFTLPTTLILATLANT